MNATLTQKFWPFSMLARLALSVFCVLAIWVVLCIGNIRAEVQDSNATKLAEQIRLPNVLLLVADDLGYGELGCQGNTEIPTPRIDELAASGVRCTAAYVTAPNCSPSRAGFFTGRIPLRFGYEFNPIGARNEDPGTGLPATETSLAEHLRATGYISGLIGKWHLGGHADYHPQRHGFDEFFGFLHEGHFFVPPPWLNTTSMLRRKALPFGLTDHYFETPNLIYGTYTGRDEPPYDANNPVQRGGTPIVEPRYLTDAFAQESVDFIERHQRSPFFLAVTFNAVHSPMQAKTETLAKLSDIDDLQRRIFAAMLTDLDSGIGEILDQLDRLNLRGNTLIFFLSDNGGPTRELTSSNLPLRDGKGSMYEGGLRVPFIASWPNHIEAGQVCDEVISSLDIFATASVAAGLKTPDALDGMNILPVLQGQANIPDRELYWRQGTRAAFRQGRWKLVSPKTIGSRRVWELYDLESDISESQNLAAQQTDVLQRLLDGWKRYDSQMQPPRF